jgi:hypothetical protein
MWNLCIYWARGAWCEQWWKLQWEWRMFFPCKGYTQLQATGHFNLLYTVHVQHNLYNTVTVLSLQHRLDKFLRTVTIQLLHLKRLIFCSLIAPILYFLKLSFLFVFFFYLKLLRLRWRRFCCLVYIMCWKSCILRLSIKRKKERFC